MLSDTEIRDIHRILRVLPAKFKQLEIALTRQSQFGSAYVDGGKNAGETPLYFDNGASEAWSNTSQLIYGYTKRIVHDWPVPYSTPQRKLSATEFLIENIFMLRPYDDAFDEFLEAYNEINRVIDIPRMRIYLGECKGCHGKLYGDPEKDEEQCISCAYPYNPKARREEHQKQGEDMLVTAKDARRYIGEVMGIPLTQGRFNNWTRRGYLGDRGTLPNTREKIYRLGDVIRCVEARAKESGDKSVRT